MTRTPNLAARKRILEAACRLFHERGYRGVSMDDVAKGAGIKKPNLFHYYPSKDDLGAAVVALVSEREKARVRAALSGDGDPLKTVGAMFSESCSDMRASSCRRGCLIGNLAQEVSDEHPRLRARISECLRFWTGELAAFLRRAQRRGALRGGIDPPRAAEAILSLLEGATLFSKANRDVSALENARRLALEYLEGTAR